MFQILLSDDVVVVVSHNMYSNLLGYVSMGSQSDCTSDPDEELPVFDFLQPASHRRAEKPDFDGFDAAAAAVSSPGRGSGGVCMGMANVTIISSSSDDDDAPYVPLAQRIKARRDNVISTSSIVTNENDAEHCLPLCLPSSQFSGQNGFSESECPLGSHQVRKMGCGQELPLNGARNTDTFPSKRKLGKRMVEEIQVSREVALSKREAKKRQQPDKDVLREERERQKMERKALAEAARALRPEECIKHMVVVVDPGKKKTLNYTWQCR